MQPTANTVGTNLRIGNVKLVQTYDQNTFTEIQASINSGPQTYFYYFPHQSNLGVYHEPTFPSIANLSYIDVMPSPNTSTIDTINIVVDWLSSLFLQPYTQLRGGLIAGSTTDRHVFNIQQWGGNICLTSYFELIFWGNDRYSYKGGEVSFFGPRGCLLFGNGGKMVIEDDATLNYGRSQQGLLALLPGGTIEIGKNAALNISNTLVLNGHPDIPGEPQVYMTLNHGSALNFLPGARIENKSDNAGMKLNIYMEGGEVDLSGLSKKELKYVNLIYRNQYEEQDKNLTIIENPVKDEVRIEYISSSQSNARMEVYDMSGAKVKSIKLSVQPGINYLNFSVLDISQGSYLISFKCKRDNFSRKIIKL
ncbi:MAG: T9SS type A sorting domain-containing protein [Bacteroidia bacterium]|nr:T9SS type A sorting domain-containing protein [Bacteroidia bacterium]